MAKLERKLYQILKQSNTDILLDRIENWAVPGVPDLLCFNKNKIFFTLELKATIGNKVRFSPHQVSWHLRHDQRAFILVARFSDRGKKATVAKMQHVGGLRAGGPTHFFLYKSCQIMDLVSRGLKVDPIVGGLRIDEIIKFLNGLGALAPSP